jgi:LysM repeat protein
VEETAPETTPIAVTPVEPMPEVVVTPPPPPPPAKPVEPVKPVVTPKKPVVVEPVVYTVTAGDSISAIAVRFGLHKPDILALNPEIRKNPNAIKIGQKIKLPAGTDLSIKAKPRAPKKAPVVNANDVVYTVKAGDVLGGIALRHNVKVADIKKANNLKKDTIFVGQKLTIPGAKTARPSKPVVTKKDIEKPTKTEKKVEKKTEKKAEATVEKLPEQKKEEVKETTPPVVPEDAKEEYVPALDTTEVSEAAAENVPEETSPAVNGTTYIVKDGEDLLAVACRWNISVSALRAANNLDSAAGYAVAPGTTLIIPNVE